MPSAKKRAVFLDRDGTINKLVYYPEHGIVDSPFVPSQFKLVAGAGPALRQLRNKGFLLVLISNQPGMAKGHMDREAFDAIDRKLDSLLEKHGAYLDAKYYCLHHPQAKVAALKKNCSCRKPKPGLLRMAAKKFGISLKHSYMVGDGVVDVKSGQAAGCRTVFVGAFKPELWKHFGAKKKPSAVFRNLVEAARGIK